MASPEVSTLSSFVTRSCCSSVDVGKRTPSVQGSGTVIVAGSQDGSLYRMRLTLPSVPGSSPSAIRFQGGDFDEAELLPFSRPHSAPCTSVSVHENSNLAASVSLDGSIAVTNLEVDKGPAASQILHDARGAVSFSSCTWTTTGNTLVTSTHQGRVHVWDTRKSKSTMGVGCDEFLQKYQSPLISLAASPAKPHACVVGSVDGRFSEWDFRYPDHPVYMQEVNGAITSIVYESQGSTVERLRFCTESGSIFKVVHGEAHLLYEEPYGGFQSLCVAPTGTDSQIFGATHQEAIIYIGSNSKFY